MGESEKPSEGKEEKKGKKWFKSIIGVIILIGCIILVLLGIPIIGDLLWHIFFPPGSIASWIFGIILGIFCLIGIYSGIRIYYRKARRKTIFIISIFIAGTIFFFRWPLPIPTQWGIGGKILGAMFMSFFWVGVFIIIYNGIRWLIRKARRQKK